MFFSLIPINIVLANDNSPPIGNIIGYWNLDSISGSTAIDLSSNHYNGTCINTENTDWKLGKVGNCLELDGID